MKKLLVLSILLTGCSISEPTSKQIDEMYRYYYEHRVKETVKTQLTNMNERYKSEAKDCIRISKCLAKPTYLDYNARTDNYYCRLAETNKTVSCYIEGNE